MTGRIGKGKYVETAEQKHVRLSKANRTVSKSGQVPDQLYRMGLYSQVLTYTYPISIVSVSWVVIFRLYWYTLFKQNDRRRTKWL